MGKRKQTGVIERLANWIASFRRVDGIELPNEGRSSVENVTGGYLSSLAIGSVIPEIPFETLRILKRLSICNPDFSQMVGNIIALGNTGHQITVDAASDSVAEAALTRINDAAPRLYPNGAGIDGLINAYLRQSVVFGALSSEDVVDFAGKRVEKVVIVPIEQIRFRYIDGQYVPHQQPTSWLGLRTRENRGIGPLGLIPLNPNTYRYLALETIENSPYAKPPATAAVDLLEGPQKDAIDNIKYIVQKFGILGMVAVNLTKPPHRPGESDEQYAKRAQTYLQSVREVLSGNFMKGLLVLFNDQKVQHTNVVSDARGAAEFFQTIEELAFSGMGSMAWAHGRNYTTTETFADVVYNILLSQMMNHQRLAKRRVERTYDLDLMLAGIPVDNVTVEFNRAEARDVLKKAQADQAKQSMAIERARVGITSPDQCAQELGYQQAEDPELLSAGKDVATMLSARRLSGLTRKGVTATCRFDRTSQRYRLVSSRIELASDPIEADSSNLIDFKKKAAALAA